MACRGESVMAPLPLFFRSELRRADGGFRRSICRLGLATRGAGHLTPDDVLHAVERGVDFLNWCGAEDGLSAAIAGLGAERANVTLCVQFEARTAADARTELDH